ncbi:hypothetical protein JNW90_26610 [Micromonospora sp. STR1s_5]|nr:hypothetical protein [Micromonospora sp. STR1s_5]
MSEDHSDRVPVILIVDDEPMIRMLAVETFEDAGFELIEAGNGHQAMEVLRGGRAGALIF